MSGVRVGSRLEQLRKLRDQVTLQIQLEERRVGVPRSAARAKRPGTGRSQGAGVIALKERLEGLGITAKEVRRWAIEAGLTTSTAGPMPGALIDAYVQAHSGPMMAGDV